MWRNQVALSLLTIDNSVSLRLLEHHVENLSTLVIFLNFVMEKTNSALMTSISWMAFRVRMLTAMRADARLMISSADNSLHQVY